MMDILQQGTAAQRCANFTEEEINRALPSLHVPPSLSQQTTIYQRNNRSDNGTNQIDFPMCDSEPQRPAERNSFADFLSLIKPFAGAFDDLDLETKERMMRRFSKFASEFGSDVQEEHRKRKHGECDNGENGTFISCSFPSHTRQNTHGTKHY